MGVLLLSPVALSACSAGQVAQTADQDRDRVGGMADAGHIAIRQARLAYPDSGEYQPGGDAQLLVAITNGGQTGDTLVSITGQDFTGAVVTPPATATPTTAASSTATATGSTATGSATTGSATTGSATTGSTATGSATTGSATTGSAATTTAGTTAAATTTATTGSSDLNIPVPAGSSVYIGGNGPVVTLTGLSQALAPGQSLNVTMTFEKAGAVPVQVLVGTSTRDLPRGSAFDFTEHH
jgi:copper(I)-binding protein